MWPHFLFDDYSITQSCSQPLKLLVGSSHLQLTVADLEVPDLSKQRTLYVHRSGEEPFRHLTRLALNLDECSTDSVVHTHADVAGVVLVEQESVLVYDFLLYKTPHHR